MTNFSETSTQGWEAVVEDGQTGTRERPDTSPPVSGRKSRRKPEDISKARQLRDDILKLVEQEPRTEVELVALTGGTKGEVKSALRRLAVADLVFSREGEGWRDVPVWHHWPTLIASIKAASREKPRQRFDVVRSTGVRVA